MLGSPSSYSALTSPTTPVNQDDDAASNTWESYDSLPFGMELVDGGPVVDQLCLDDEAIRRHITSIIIKATAASTEDRVPSSAPVRRAFIHPHAFFVQDDPSPSETVGNLFRDRLTLGAFIDHRALESTGQLCPSTALLVLPRDTTELDDLSCTAAAVSPMIVTWRGRIIAQQQSIGGGSTIPLASSVIHRFPASSLAWTFLAHTQPDWLQVAPHVSRWRRAEEQMILSNREFRRTTAKTLKKWVNVKLAPDVCSARSYTTPDDTSKLTVAVSTYSANREPLLLEFIAAMALSPIVREIFVIWHDPGPESLERMGRFRLKLDAMDLEVAVTLLPQIVCFFFYPIIAV